MKIRIDDILATVADAHDLAVCDLTGRSRAGHIADARHMACYVLRHVRPDLSFVTIGKLLGGRDHTTIMASVDVAAARIAERPENAAIVDAILLALGAPPRAATARLWATAPAIAVSA